MKKFCTFFIFLSSIFSCAKKFEESKAKQDRQYASIEYRQVVSANSGEQNHLKFNSPTDIYLPNTISVDKGDSNGQLARVYIDYSDSTSTYAYFCRYSSSTEGNFFKFDACFNNEEDEKRDKPNSYYAGYSEFIYKNNSVILEVVNNLNLVPLKATMELEIVVK